MDHMTYFSMIALQVLSSNVQERESELTSVMSGLDEPGQLPALLFESTLDEEIDFLSLSLTEATNASESILPAELYIRIMENLDGKSLLTCMLV